MPGFTIFFFSRPQQVAHNPHASKEQTKQFLGYANLPWPLSEHCKEQGFLRGTSYRAEWQMCIGYFGLTSPRGVSKKYLPKPRFYRSRASLIQWTFGFHLFSDHGTSGPVPPQDFPHGPFFATSQNVSNASTHLYMYGNFPLRALRPPVGCCYGVLSKRVSPYPQWV